MENIAHIFCNPEEEYWTIPPIKSFLKENDVKVDNVSAIKENTKTKLIDAALDFAEQNEENKQIFIEWIDRTVKEGIKEIILHKCQMDEGMNLTFANEASTRKFLDVYVDTESTGYLINSKYDNKTRMVKYTLSRIRDKRVITLYFGKMITYIDKRKSKCRDIEFPVIFEYFIDEGWYLVRYKARSNLYEYHPEFQNEYMKTDYPIQDSKLVQEAVQQAMHILQLKEITGSEQSYFLKKMFYRILKQFTETPPEIKDRLDQYKNNMISMEQNIKELCRIPEGQTFSLHSDLCNLFEKYISINWLDKEIFTRHRKAYPIKLRATDEEDSHVDQTAGGDSGPLQSKAIFFDNKRMIDNDEMCDGLTLKWKRSVRTYYPETFTVRISEKRGKCYLSFKEYTAEEDIQDVLFSIIGA